MNKRTRTGANKAAMADFTEIPGVSQVIATQLRKEGIGTWEELAACAPEDLAARLEHMPDVSLETIISQRWIARALARAAGADALRVAAGQAGAGALRDVSFVLDIFLDETDHCHHTRILQVRGNADTSWEGWDENRLVDFLVERSGLKPADAGAAQQSAMTNEFAGTLETCGAHDARPVNLLSRERDFHVDLRLDRQALRLAAEQDVAWTARLSACDVDTRVRHVLREDRGFLGAADLIRLPVAREALPRGLYRFEALLSLQTLAPLPAASDVTARCGSPVQIF
ncbi:MAG: helix-hairpin-helix domain-containing protein [Blastocatellia bacterium]